MARGQLPGRVLVAHLGGGQSLCGAVDGASVWTTMGFTPADGLVMGTRSGDVDASAVAWLAARHSDLGTILERESGLLALCGDSDAEQVLDRAAAGDGAAQEALEVYRHRLVACLGETLAATGGVDTLVLTGGVGENALVVQTMVVEALRWLGAAHDPGATGEDPTADGSSVRILVVHAQEDLQMAIESEGLLGLR